MHSPASVRLVAGGRDTSSLNKNLRECSAAASLGQNIGPRGGVLVWDRSVAVPLLQALALRRTELRDAILGTDGMALHWSRWFKSVTDPYEGNIARFGSSCESCVNLCTASSGGHGGAASLKR